MRKCFVAVVLILAMLTALGTSASAVEPRTTTIDPKLSFNGTTAECRVVVTALGKEISATMELWRGNMPICSWSDSASNYLVIDESCAVVSGQSYTLKVSGTIDGDPFDGTPVSGRCFGGLLQ